MKHISECEPRSCDKTSPINNKSCSPKKKLKNDVLSTQDKEAFAMEEETPSYLFGYIRI